jgi:hypothetical protein
MNARHPRSTIASPDFIPSRNPKKKIALVGIRNDVSCMTVGSCDADTRRSQPALLQTPHFKIPRLCYPSSVWWTLVARCSGEQRSGSGPEGTECDHSVPGTCARGCVALVISAGRAGARSLCGPCMLNMRACVRACVRACACACVISPQVSNIAKDLGSRRQHMGGDMAHRRQADNRLNR